MSYFKLIAVAALSFLLAGCPGTPQIPDAEPADTTYGSDAGADTRGMDGSDPYGGEAYGEDPSAGELAMVIYFDFDVLQAVLFFERPLMLVQQGNRADQG